MLGLHRKRESVVPLYNSRRFHLRTTLHEFNRKGVPGHHTTASCKFDLPQEASLKFKWTYIVGGRKIEVAAENVNSSDTESTVSFKPEYDNATNTLGTLECIAKGFKPELLCPCLVDLLEADFPSPPENCTVKKEKDPKNGNFTVSCIESYDGGIEQKFVLVVLNPIDNITNKHVDHTPKDNWTIDNEFLNKAMGDEKSGNSIYYMDTKRTPVFHVKYPGEETVAMKVYAVNDKGQSAPVKLSTNFRHNKTEIAIRFYFAIGFLSVLMGIMVLFPAIYITVKYLDDKKNQGQCRPDQPNSRDTDEVDVAQELCQMQINRKSVTFNDQISLHSISPLQSTTDLNSYDDDGTNWRWD